MLSSCGSWYQTPDQLKLLGVVGINSLHTMFTHFGGSYWSKGGTGPTLVAL